MWLTIGPDDPSLDAVKRRYADRVRFVRLSPDSGYGREALEEYSIEKPPAHVFIDGRGRVVEKIEGKMSADEMRTELSSFIRRSKQRG